jgi:hypothetical protein
MMLSIEEMLQVVVIAFCSGIGSAVGNYFVQRAFVRQVEKIGGEKKL